MHEVKRLLRRAGLRVALGRFAGNLTITLTLALGALGVAIALERLFGVAVVWPIALWSAGGGALAVALVWTLLRWPDEAAVARLVDERAALRESLSTALFVADRADAWSRAAVAHAARLARAVDLGRTLRANPPRWWPAPLTAGAIVALLWLALPQADLLGLLARAQAEQAQEEERTQAVEQVASAQNEVREALEQAGEKDLMRELESSTPEGETDPDDIRRMAIRELTTLNERLEQRRGGEQGAALDAMRDRFSKLRPPSDGPLRAVAEALAEGNFQKASELMRSLMADAQSGEMSEEMLEALAEQMRRLAEQIEEQAQRREELQRRLAEQGIDPSLIDSPAALREAIENAEGLTDAQKQQLQQMADGARQAQQMMQDMAEAMRQAAGEMQQQQQAGQNAQQGEGQGNSGMQGEGQNSLSEQLSEMEMLEQEMQGLEAAQREVWGQLSDLSGALGEAPSGNAPPNMLELWDRRMGGGRGSGGGLLTPEEAEFSLRKEKAIGRDHGAPPIATRFVEGEQIRGESTQEFRDAVSAASKAAAEAIETQRIPREHHDAVKHYFGRLEARAKAERAEDPTPPPAEPSEPPPSDEGAGSDNQT